MTLQWLNAHEYVWLDTFLFGLFGEFLSNASTLFSHFSEWTPWWRPGVWGDGGKTEAWREWIVLLCCDTFVDSLRPQKQQPLPALLFYLIFFFFLPQHLANHTGDIKKLCRHVEEDLMIALMCEKGRGLGGGRRSDRDRVDNSGLFWPCRLKRFQLMSEAFSSRQFDWCPQFNYNL